MTSLRIFLIGVIFLFNNQLQAETLNSLLEQGQQNLSLGHFYEANKQLQQLEAQSIQAQDDYTATLAKGLQGYIALQRQDNTTAEQLLTTALTQAQAKSWPDLIVRFTVYLGELSERQQNLTQAQHYFSLAQTQADKVADKSFLISSLINQAKLSISTNKPEIAWQQLQQAKTLLDQLTVSQTSSQLWLSLGYQTGQLYELNKKNDCLAQAFYDLDKALVQAKQFSQLRTQATSLKYLAMLYKQQQRPNEAIKLLLESMQIAQKDNAEDILLDLDWQLAQLYKTQHQPQEAISAYRQALKHLENIRLDIPVSYQKGRSSFKDTFAPLYLGLADLLLQQAPLANPQQQQVLLKEAQDTIELMKKSELEDYFQSRCEITATPINLKQTDPHAAAIYPISLPDRLELIVYTAEGLHQFTQPIKAYELEQLARLFSSNLRQYVAFEQSTKQAQLLYQWLISPIRPLLEQQKIDTLVYIPDGALRLVPLAALYDGKKFLIEDYAVVISPGMSLITANVDSHAEKTLLLAGMSIPGDVINDLPDSLLMSATANITKTEKRSLTRDLKSIIGKQRELTAAETEQRTRELREVLRKPGMIEKLRESLSLPGVDVEVKQLAQQQNVPYLLNESFSLANLSETLIEQPHKVVHIASHGFFGTTAEESFIMTYDKILTIDKLESLLSSDFFKLHPIDLITLSACQTAEGDDRSPLGISGIAIKAKVHSALGSLWSVADEATSQLMSTFYQGLETSNLSKAKALQQAELHLLKQKQFDNPSFWSPFILVGNWN
jgi:CHAT domain-containing protein